MPGQKKPKPEAIDAGDGLAGQDEQRRGTQASQGGGSGDAPVCEAQDSEQAAEVTTAGSAEFSGGVDIAGDYLWSHAEDQVECTLRMRPTGQWWHAAHRSSTERGRIVNPAQKVKKPQKAVSIHKAYKEHGTAYEEREAEDLSQRKADYEEVQIWELVETSGSWREVQVLPTSCGQDETPAAAVTGVLMTCENCNWKSNFPDAPLSFFPSADGRAEIDATLASGQLVLCFVHDHGDDTRGKSLKLHVDLATVTEWTGARVQEIPRHARLRSMQTAFQTLGFTRAYSTAKAAREARVTEQRKSIDVADID